MLQFVFFCLKGIVQFNLREVLLATHSTFPERGNVYERFLGWLVILGIYRTALKLVHLQPARAEDWFVYTGTAVALTN